MEVKTEKTIIRQASIDEIDDLCKIEKDSWEENKAATREMILSRIKTFPEGVFCAIKAGKIRGFAVNELIAYKNLNHSNPTWKDLTDNGFIRKSHDYMGDSLFGVSISVPAYINDKKVALRLYEYGGKLAIRYNLEKVYAGSRLPKYYKYSDKMTVNEYVHAKTKTGRILDPELALYCSIGMKIEKIIPNYFHDPESLNYGVLVSWTNPFYRFTKHSKLLAKILSGFFRL